MNIRPATEDDLRQWFRGVPVTMRAVVVEDGGQLLGVAGVAYNHDHAQVFSHIKPELRANKIALGRFAVKTRRMLESVPGRLYALCAADEPTSPRLLEWGGFKRWTEGVWRRG